MYKFLLCLRYLRTRYIALASIISVTLGVATMIVVNSVMAGFSTEMRTRIHGLLSDIIIETHSMDGMDNPDALLERVEKVAGDEIDGMTATVEVYGMLSFEIGSKYVTRPVTLIGIKPQGKAAVGPLEEYLLSYQAVRENGKLIRPPLREPDEPLSWRLTDQAQQRRNEWVEAQNSWLRWARHSEQAARPDEGVVPASANERSANKPPVIAETPPESTGGAAGSPEAESASSIFGIHEIGQSGAAGDPSGDAEQPAAGPPNIFPATEAEKQAAAQRKATKQPRDARLYVGQGLISYAEEDSQTGKVKTHLLVKPGDDVKVSTIGAGRPPEPVHFDATIVDIFKSGMSEYDSNLVFCNLDYLQQQRGMFTPGADKGRITTIQIKLKDFHNADRVVEQLKTAFNPQVFSVNTWEQKQGPLLAAVDVESTILNVLLFLIIAVAGFGILAIFFMIVVEKTRDIGILKALGASSRGIMTIFLSYGLALGIVGSGVGTILGLLFVRYINEIEKLITYVSGRKVFDERIYYFPEIPTDVSAVMVLWVAAGAIAIAVMASILPARRAARLHPVEALRYE